MICQIKLDWAIKSLLHGDGECVLLSSADISDQFFPRYKKVGMFM